MKIQFLNGGLANQAFQYIFARYYELSHPGDVMYLDDSYFALHTVHNGYELGKVFGITPHMLSECFDEEVWNYILEERRGGKSVPQILCENGIETYMISEVGNNYKAFNPFSGKVLYCRVNGFYPEILEQTGDIYYHGYWINNKWFGAYKAEFLKEFRFPEITDSRNREYLERIQKVNSLAIHIRRGDYVTLGIEMTPEVYRNNIKTFVENAQGQWELFVFSDDIAWCREHQEEIGFSRFANVTFIEGNVNGRNYIDMQLMTQCKAMILSNSAFCYLAALLNTGGLQYYITPENRDI